MTLSAVGQSRAGALYDIVARVTMWLMQFQAGQSQMTPLGY